MQKKEKNPNNYFHKDLDVHMHVHMWHAAFGSNLTGTA